MADNESGKSVMSEVRTSSGMFLSTHQVIDDILIVGDCLFMGFC